MAKKKTKKKPAEPPQTTTEQVTFRIPQSAQQALGMKSNNYEMAKRLLQEAIDLVRASVGAPDEFVLTSVPTDDSEVRELIFASPDLVTPTK